MFDTGLDRCIIIVFCRTPDLRYNSLIVTVPYSEYDHTYKKNPPNSLVK